MRQTMKRAATIFLSLAVLLTFTPFVGQWTGGAIGAQEAYAANFPQELSVGYREADGTEHTVRLSSEKPGFINGNPEAQALPEGEQPVNVFNAYYDVANHTLMLNNYRGKGIDERTGSGDLTIVLLGNNTIDGRGNNALNIQGRIEILSQNNGKLTITNNYSSGSSYGIRAGNGVWIHGNPTLDITANTTSTNTTDDAYGIQSSAGDILIEDNAQVTINASTSSDTALGDCRGIYTHNGSIGISTAKPMSITLTSRGSGGGAVGIHANGGSVGVAISNTPSITMDLTAADDYERYALLPQSAVTALEANDYGYSAIEGDNHLSYTIAPKKFVPETIDIKLDRTNLQQLTPDLTGKDVAAYFFISIQSSHGDTRPTYTSDGWYVRLGDVTGVCDDVGDPRNIENSTESLEWGEPYFLSFEVRTDTAHKWNPEQSFTINEDGGEGVIVSAPYEVDGETAYQVSLRMICEDNLNRAQMEPVEDAVYSGSAYKPTPAITYNGETLANDDHYVITYEDAEGNAVAAPTNAGDYQLIATGKYAFYGTLCTNFAITPKEITPKVTAADKTYTGKVLNPVLTVKDGTKKLTTANYTRELSGGRKNVGKYKVTVNMRGNYTGTATTYFKINPKGTSLKSLTAGSKSITVKWNKQATKMSTSYITGYQIQIATNSKFTKGVKNYTATKYSTVSKKLTKLTGKKKYYVRIRTYKTVSGTKYYSPWSKSKYVTTKK